jgi:hypothetical protein
MNADRLNRLKRWRTFWEGAAEDKATAYVRAMFPTVDKFAWHLRSQREALIAAGALVKLPSRDLLIDPVEHRRFVAGLIAGATERATTTA